MATTPRRDTSARADPVGPLLPRIQTVLDEFLDRQRSLLGAASGDLMPLADVAADFLRGGKRLRASFCYWGWRAAGRDDDDAVLVAASALELFQASALVHDDVIDGSDTRRGAPAVHRRFAERHRVHRWDGDPDAFGTASAVLMGDLLLGWSDELFTRSGVPDDALRRARPVFEQMRTEVGAGQYLDMLEQAGGAERAASAADRARTVIRYKSARYSVQHPLVIGARLADADDTLVDAYAGYGAALGEAFQLRDDVLGVFGDPSRTGKPAGDDLREGKRTLLVAYALERADAAQRDQLVSHLGDPDLGPDGVAVLRDVLVDTGALTRVETLLSSLVSDAEKALASAVVTDEGRDALEALIDHATDRAH